MPVDPSVGERLAADVTRLYADAELRILEQVARRLARGMDSPRWLEEKLAEVQTMRRIISGELAALDGTVRDQIAATLSRAYDRGGESALADLLAARGPTRRTVALPAFRAVALLAAETAAQLTGTHSRILRSVDDVYRQVIANSAPTVLQGVLTRRQATQRALDDFARQGVTGFTDRAGRRWSLTAYAEMATRAATGRAAVQGHTDRLQAEGLDLVVVADAPQECKLCRPFEGKVLSLSGRPAPPGVTVLDTLDGARRAGFQHPGCRHAVSLYQHGRTRLPKDTADPQGDLDRQRLRALERQLRAAKRTQAVALDEPARRAAGAKVRALQGRIREHVDTTSAKRQPARERLQVGDPTRTVPPVAATVRPMPPPAPTVTDWRDDPDDTYVRPAADLFDADLEAELVRVEAEGTDFDRMEQLADELDRRERVEAGTAEATARDVARWEAQGRAEMEAEGRRGSNATSRAALERQAAADYEPYLEAMLDQAEAATRGHAVTAEGRAEGVTLRDMLDGSRRSEAWKTPEFQEWEARARPMTRREFIDNAVGDTSGNEARSDRRRWRNEFG